jgi:hypothetical protein
MGRARYFALIIFGEEQETRPLQAQAEPEARAEAQELARGLEREGRVVLFRDKSPKPLLVFSRRSDGGVIEAAPEEG